MSKVSDALYGRQGGRFQDPWTDAQEEQYQADLAAHRAAEAARAAALEAAPPSLFDLEAPAP